ncbi:MAG TPA: hypothetical protein VGL81_29060 [Polyangiaceae bacterium]|jgi:hypothetical protein
MRALLAIVPVAAVFSLSACSGTSPGNIFVSTPLEAGPPSVNNGDAGNLFNGPPEAGTTSTPAECNPQAIQAFQPVWQPPEPWKQNVCTTAQISSFYDSCLTPPISKAACDAFVQQNANCAPCLQSQDSDATAAAIVWHEEMQYWTVNVAGCIAQATGDATASGCGASYAAAISCRQSSCNACWEAQGTSATFQEFSDCETLAGSTTCQTFAEAVPSKCGNLDTPPANVCMPNSGATAQQAFMQVAPLFCGP